MTRRIEITKKAIWTLFTSAIVLSLVFVVSCDNGDGDDPEPELYDLAGVYIFKSATLQTEVTINIGIPVTVPAGRDITSEMSGGLLAEANCKDPDNGAVEMKANNELFYTCRGEDSEIKAGGWTVNGDTTELSLNLASPPLPAALQMKLVDVIINETTDVIGGSIISFPLTPDLMAGFLDGYGLSQEQIDGILANLPAATLVDVDIEFQKVTD